MTDHEGYWTKLEAELDRLSAARDEDESDPWATLDLTPPALTPEQRAALADQPGPSTLSDTAPLPDGADGPPTDPLTDGGQSDSATSLDPTGKPPGVSGEDVA